MKMKQAVSEYDEDSEEESIFGYPWLIDETGQLILHMFFMLSKNDFYKMKDPVQLLVGPAFQSYVKTGEIESRHVAFWDSVYRWYRLACKKNDVIPLKMTDKLLGEDED
jgi:hypothetical protein